MLETRNKSRENQGSTSMNTFIKLGTITILGFILFFGNLFYRVYFVPEILSDVALKQMDKSEGDAPAVIMRTHTELADWGAFFSSIFFLVVILALFSPEITKTIKSQTQGASTCGENGSPPPSS